MAGLRVRAKTNEDEVFRQVDAFVDTIRNVAGPRALNKLGDQAQTAFGRAANDEYGIGPRTTAKYTTIRAARPGDLEVELTVKGKGFPLIDLGARQTRKGVSVTIKRVRQTFRSTFIATMPNGHQGVFARGAYGGKGGVIRSDRGSIGHFVLGKGRLPINELRTFSPADMLNNPAVRDPVNARLAEQAPKVLAQEVRFATRGGSQ